MPRFYKIWSQRHSATTFMLSSSWWSAVLTWWRTPPPRRPDLVLGEGRAWASLPLLCLHFRPVMTTRNQLMLTLLIGTSDCNMLRAYRIVGDAVDGVLAAHTRTARTALHPCAVAGAVALAAVRSATPTHSLGCKGVRSCFDYCLLPKWNYREQWKHWLCCLTLTAASLSSAFASVFRQERQRQDFLQTTFFAKHSQYLQQK